MNPKPDVPEGRRSRMKKKGRTAQRDWYRIGYSDGYAVALAEVQKFAATAREKRRKKDSR